MTFIVFAAAGVLVLCLVIWAGHRMVRNPAPNAGGIADGLGNFNDVFDPARARADQDLKSKDNQGEIIPRPDDDDDHPIRIDHAAMRVHIRRPRPPADQPGSPDPQG